MKAKDYLGNKCKGCGALDNLEFDHINRNTQSFRISQGLNYGWDKLMTELNLCQLLCKPCHRKKTFREMKNTGKWKVELEHQHGTASMYSNHKCRCDQCQAAWAEYFRSKNHYR